MNLVLYDWLYFSNHFYSHKAIEFFVELWYLQYVRAMSCNSNGHREFVKERCLISTILGLTRRELLAMRLN